MSPPNSVDERSIDELAVTKRSIEKQQPNTILLSLICLLIIALAVCLKVSSNRIQELNAKLLSVQTETKRNAEEAEREKQTEREQRFLDTVKQNELLNLQLDERRTELAKQYAELLKKAKKEGFEFNPQEAVDKPPQLEAQVLKVNANNTLVEISIGSDDGLKKGHRLQVFRGKDYLGQITIKDIEVDRAVGEVDKKLQRGLIREKDNVTTKQN